MSNVTSPPTEPAVNGHAPAATPLTDREALIGLVRLFRAYTGNLRRELTAWQGAMTELDEILARWEEQGRDVPAPAIELPAEPIAPPRPRVQAAPHEVPTAAPVTPEAEAEESEEPLAAPVAMEAPAAEPVVAEPPAEEAFGELRLADEEPTPAPGDDTVDLGAAAPAEEAERTLNGQPLKNTMVDLEVPAAPAEAEAPARPEADPAYLSNRYVQKGIGYVRQRELRRALACFNEALRLHDRNAAALLERGQLFRACRKHENAIHDFNAALEIEASAEGHVRRGNALTDQGRLDEALADYAAAIQVAPDHAVAYLNRALVHARRRHFAGVIEDAGAALQLDPQLSSAYFLRGAAYSSEGKYDLALADLNRAAELDPKNALVLNERGLACARMEQYADAIANYGRALRLAPKLHVARFNRALAHRLNGDHDLAIAELTGFLRIQPRSAPAYYQRGLAHRGKNDHEPARADFEKALELNPAYEEARAALAEMDRADRREPETAPEPAPYASTPPEPPPPPEPRVPTKRPEPALADASQAAAAVIAGKPVGPAKKKPAKKEADGDEPPLLRRVAPYVAGVAAVAAIGYVVLNLGSGAAEAEDHETEYAQVIENEPLVRLNSAELAKRFTDAPTESASKYKQEVLEVVGIVQEIKKGGETTTLVLKDSKGGAAQVECVLVNAPSGKVSLEKAEKEKGRPISVKGVCEGKDGTAVKLVGCRLVGVAQLGGKGKKHVVRD